MNEAVIPADQVEFRAVDLSISFKQCCWGWNNDVPVKKQEVSSKNIAPLILAPNNNEASLFLLPSWILSFLMALYIFKIFDFGNIHVFSLQLQVLQASILRHYKTDILCTSTFKISRSSFHPVRKDDAE